MLWSVDPRGDELLRRVGQTVITGENEEQIHSRRGLFVIVAYLLPKRKSTKHGYKDHIFQDNILKFFDHLKSFEIGQPCLFNLGSRSHLGVINHVASYEDLQEAPLQSIESAIDRLELVYQQILERQ